MIKLLLFCTWFWFWCEMLHKILGAIRAWCWSRRHRDRLGWWRASYRCSHCIQYTLWDMQELRQSGLSLLYHQWAYAHRVSDVACIFIRSIVTTSWKKWYFPIWTDLERPRRRLTELLCKAADMTPTGDVDASLRQFLLVFFRSPISFHHSPGVPTLTGLFKVTNLWAS